MKYQRPIGEQIAAKAFVIRPKKIGLAVINFRQGNDDSENVKLYRAMEWTVGRCTRSTCRKENIFISMTSIPMCRLTGAMVLSALATGVVITTLAESSHIQTILL